MDDSGIRLCNGGELLSNGYTVNEMRQRIAEGKVDRPEHLVKAVAMAIREVFRCSSR